MRIIITSKSNPDIHAADLSRVMNSRSLLYAEINGKPGPWRVLNLSLSEPWSATVELVEDDSGPRGPTTEPRRRRG